MNLIHSRNEPNVLSVPFVAALSIGEAQRGVQFSVLRAKFGADLIVGKVVVLLREAIGHFNHSITADDLVGYARRIITDWYFWRIEDLAICLNRGIRGDYGHSMARWTYGDTFVTWAENYDRERVQWCVDNNTNKKFSDTRELEINPSIFTDELKAKFKPRVLTDESKKAETMRNDLTDRIMGEFDKLFNEQCPTAKGLRMVKYRDRMVDIREYMEMRLDEC